MVSGITSSISNQSTAQIQNLTGTAQSKPSEKDLQLKEKFQDFTAGTFYKQMLKTLRSSQHKPAYMHGGHAEEVFQGQLDQTITDSLAKSHGKGFAEPLFAAYTLRS